MGVSTLLIPWDISSWFSHATLLSCSEVYEGPGLLNSYIQVLFLLDNWSVEQWASWHMAFWCWPLMEFPSIKPLILPLYLCSLPLTLPLPLYSFPFFLPSLWNLGQEKKSRLQILPNLLCLTPEPLALEKLNSQVSKWHLFFPLVTFWQLSLKP